MKKAIAYYRVSTAQQGESGLGLKGQRESVERFAANNGFDLIAPPFTEVETGTNKRQRPQLTKALAKCHTTGATLLIAKIDRLARNVHFISGLMESGVKFIAVDMPEIDNLTLHILAAVAEKEAKLISERTKAGIAQSEVYKSGNWGHPENMTRKAQRKGAAVRKQAAHDYYKPITGYIRMMRENGYSYAKIATTLNDDGNTTIKGKQFTPILVSRILARSIEMEA